MMKKIVCGLLMLSLSEMVFGQTGVVTFDMPWKATSLFTLVPVKTSSTGTVSEIPGQAQTVNLPLALTPIVVQATFPGQTTSPMVISGFRVKGSPKASWISTITVTQMLQSPITVPTGRPLVVQMIYSATNPTGQFSWAPDLQTLTGVITPPPTTTPPPVVPPTPSVASPAGSSVPPLTQLTDPSGAVWMLVGTNVLLNGKDVGVSAFQTDTNQLLMSANNVVRAISPSHGYICFLNGAWTGSGC